MASVEVLDGGAENELIFGEILMIGHTEIHTGRSDMTYCGNVWDNGRERTAVDDEVDGDRSDGGLKALREVRQAERLR